VQIRVTASTSRHSETSRTMSIRISVAAGGGRARRLCTEIAGPVIDVSRRSIEETAATIIQMLARYRGDEAAPNHDDGNGRGSGTRVLAAAAASVVLASASPVRAALLRAAGIPITVDVAAIDEAEVKTSLRAARAEPAAIAEALAELKAQRVALRASRQSDDRRRPGVGVRRDPLRQAVRSSGGAKSTLGPARSRSSAGERRRVGARWPARLGTMSIGRPQDAQFQHGLSGSLPAIGWRCGPVVGGRLSTRGVGAQLFAAIDGDYFTILGLPLLPLLDILREHGILPS